MQITENKDFQIMLKMLYNGFKQQHTGIIRMAGYRDKCVAMTHPKAANGASPVVCQHRFNITQNIRRRAQDYKYKVIMIFLQFSKLLPKSNQLAGYSNRQPLHWSGLDNSMEIITNEILSCVSEKIWKKKVKQGEYWTSKLIVRLKAQYDSQLTYRKGIPDMKFDRNHKKQWYLKEMYSSNLLELFRLSNLLLYVHKFSPYSSHLLLVLITQLRIYIYIYIFLLFNTV